LGSYRSGLSFVVLDLHVLLTELCLLMTIMSFPDFFFFCWMKKLNWNFIYGLNSYRSICLTFFNWIKFINK
jgi:hypothetical protein